MSQVAQAAPHRERLWDAVVAGDEYAGVAVVQEALTAGLDAEAVLLDVIAPVQEKVGEEWAADRIGVAVEHAATAVNERVVAAVAHRAAGGADRAPRGRVTVGCVDGEWHAFPSRLVAEVLRLRGWRVDYLGGQTPTPHLIAHLHHTDPQAVLLSGSLPTRLPAAHTAITACQAVGVPVLAGGRAFGRDGEHARALGADAWAPDARGAADVLARGLPRPAPAAVRQVVDDLPHLADQEYTLVVHSRGQLVKQTLVDLEDRFPAVRSYSDVQRERTAEDVAHIVDFLACALYVDDPEVFSAFLTWTAGILEARGVPARSLSAGLDLLAARLHDFPRASRLLDEGSRALAARPGDLAAGPGTRV
ncbi:cobalamin-binding protein [Streptomyces misionensis]|uniref:Cobalamin-binding protein n=1 Tax=Streptomyces misionensis TaxID=67331 RepID=A0A5C6ISC5_9ACTN|nr:B12-binding domain-containing protein [Streptomyces misionensis]TWV31513.1 cobalamin-binding protein [Streptomyces misionensis]